MRQQTFDKLQAAIGILRDTFYKGTQLMDGGYPIYQISNRTFNVVPVKCGVTKALAFHLKELGYIKYIPGGMYQTTIRFNVSDAGITTDVLDHMKQTQAKWHAKQERMRALAEVEKPAKPELFPTPEVEIIPVNDRKIRKLTDDVLIAALKSHGYKVMKQVTELREV